jgi:hypothetical protein
MPREIDGVRIIGIDVPGFGVPTHAEAKDVLAGAMLKAPFPRRHDRAGGKSERIEERADLHRIGREHLAEQCGPRTCSPARC